MSKPVTYACMKLCNNLKLLVEVKVEKWQTISLFISVYLLESQLQWNFFLNGVHLGSCPIFSVLRFVEGGVSKNQSMKPLNEGGVFLSAGHWMTSLHIILKSICSWIVPHLITYVHRHRQKTVSIHHFSLILNMCWEFWKSDCYRSYLWLCSYTCSLETYKVITRLFFLSLSFCC